MKQVGSAKFHAKKGGQIVVSEKMHYYLEKYFNFKKCEKDMPHIDANDMAYYLYLEDKPIKLEKFK